MKTKTLHSSTGLISRRKYEHCDQNDESSIKNKAVEDFPYKI